MNWIDKKVLVIGAGKTGRAVSGFLAAKGARVTLTDKKTAGELDLKASDLPGIRLALGSYANVKPGQWDLVVTSPGVPPEVPPLIQARQHGIKITGEVELAWLHCRAPVIAITGTNGKTTTTALVGEMLKNAGYRTLVAGNIGIPLISAVEDYGPDDVIVAEISSFQLETARTFRPHVAAVLNLTPDHLDRHGDMRGYGAAKARIFARQHPNDWTILNFDDPLTREMASITPGEVIFFSCRHKLEQGIFVQDGQILVHYHDQQAVILATDQLQIPGTHNLENALAATAIGWAFGLGPTEIAQGIKAFKGVPHRLEFVAEIDGVRYINDSKGTNPEAAIKALQAFHEPIVLIAGGRNKGSGFADFAAAMKNRVRAVVVLGESAAEIVAACRKEGIHRIEQVADIPAAVRCARDLARRGDVVLLSPACASWDMFSSYEERGDLFKRVVRQLAKEAG
ncbi:MAG: UDP-N-acetylmuramoyl-L-alanine--D-glutamate ligase [Peptococcaceae bacterium]|nr:UDP-N-acetylmuramoyl-L-alanine--D-glutamate ligase [Peptococcaceae bacterium]